MAMDSFPHPCSSRIHRLPLQEAKQQIPWLTVITYGCKDAPDFSRDRRRCRKATESKLQVMSPLCFACTCVSATPGRSLHRGGVCSSHHPPSQPPSQLRSSHTALMGANPRSTKTADVHGGNSFIKGQGLALVKQFQEPAAIL